MGILNRLRAFLQALVVLTLIGVGGVAWADERDEARGLADRGYELYQERRYEEANTHFREAERRYHAPTLVLMIARTYEKLGAIADAERSYTSITQERLASDASQEFHEAQDAAARALKLLTPRVPRIVFRFPAGGHDRVAVTIDDHPVPSAVLLAPVGIDPGEHTIVVRRPNMDGLTRNVHLAEAQRETLVVEVLPREEGEQLGPAPDGASPWVIGGIVSLSLGVAGLAVGIVGGVVALDHQAALESACPSRVCDAADRSLLDNGETAATVSTIGFVAGGALAAAGAALLVVSLVDDDDEVALIVVPTLGGAWLVGAW